MIIPDPAQFPKGLDYCVLTWIRKDCGFGSILVGHMTDQAALSGVLNTLYELHLPLLSVENMDEE
jgi:hypothetical protein